MAAQSFNFGSGLFDAGHHKLVFGISGLDKYILPLLHHLSTVSGMYLFAGRNLSRPVRETSYFTDFP
jgi:hypothetical protein